MKERTGVVTMQGNPLTLVGNEVKVGQPAPDAELVASEPDYEAALKAARDLL